MTAAVGKYLTKHGNTSIVLEGEEPRFARGDHELVVPAAHRGFVEPVSAHAAFIIHYVSF